MGSASMPASSDLVWRSGDLKRALLEFAQRPRFARRFRQALERHFSKIAAADEAKFANFLDSFVLQQRLPDGGTLQHWATPGAGRGGGPTGIQIIGLLPATAVDTRRLVGGSRATLWGSSGRDPSGAVITRGLAASDGPVELTRAEGAEGLPARQEMARNAFTARKAETDSLAADCGRIGPRGGKQGTRDGLLAKDKVAGSNPVSAPSN